MSISLPYSRWSNLLPRANSTPTTPQPTLLGWGLDATQSPGDLDIDQYLPKLLNDLADEMCHAIGADRLTVESWALGACALAVQGLYDQQRPNCPSSSCSLFVLLLSNTSGLKSTIMRILFQPAQDLEAEQNIAVAQGAVDETTEKRTWEIERKACEKAMAKAWNKPKELELLKEKLREILGRERKEKPPARLIYEDTTWPALVDGMYRHSPSAALVTDEASAFFGGPLAALLAKFDKAWDGANIIQDRKTSDSFSLRNTRLSLILALQNRPFKKFIKSNGVDAAELGFLPRLLVARSGKIGRRGIAGRKNVSHEARGRYHAWATKLFKRYAEKIQTGDLSRTTLPMSTDAELQWIATFEWLAQAVQPGGSLEPFEGYIAKCGENIARIAVIFQILDNVDSTEVSIVNMRRAIRACRKYTEQYMEVFGSVYFAEDEVDAAQIERWLHHYQQRMGTMEISTRELRQCCWGGPELRNDKDRIDAALGYLEVNGKIMVRKYGTRIVIHLSPDFFGSAAAYVLKPGNSGLFIHQ
ncbi:MAG: DUF3987 domain-containing protein [Collimonas pratensis]|uniref:DUF3987 domain-containing protein n=1 Tax=Collimonas pratensis TaxID=279113 RepID=UPI003C76E2C8